MKNLSLRMTLAGLALASLVGCGGATTFAGGEPTTVAGTRPEAAQPAPVAEAPKRVHVSDDHIVIDEKIQFENNKSVIMAVSDPLIDEIAAEMKANPQIKKIEVQGHASSEGDAKKNLALSDARAKAVMAALVVHGVEAERMTAKGYGEEKPIASNDTEEGREKNRRVEFLILDPAPKAAAADAATLKKAVIKKAR